MDGIGPSKSEVTASHVAQHGSIFNPSLGGLVDKKV